MDIYTKDISFSGAPARERVSLRAYAKLNLTLDVLFKRGDGYHELRMLMHGISLCDVVTVTANGSDGDINVCCTEPLPENNTAYAAAARYIGLTGCGGVDISIEKGIPSQAGLGGASADAAGVLRAMNLLFGGAGEDELYGIGKAVGADVPFCLHGGCALAEGIGERLTALEPVKLHLLVVKGERGVSTGELFRSLRLPAGGCGSEPALDALKKRDVRALASRLYNALMPAAESFVPEIAEYRRRMLDAGALGACMTGSGSAVYGIFADEKAARTAYEAFEGCAFRAVCETVDRPFGAALPEPRTPPSADAPNA